MEKSNVGVGTWILGAVGALGVIIAIIYATGGIQYLTAEFRGTVSAEERVQGGDYRIAAYEHFYDLCAAVQADEDRLNNLEEENEGTDDAQRSAQLDTSITAVKNSRDSKIREYNSDARQEATRGQFRDSDLPYELDTEAETTCYAE